MKALKLLLTTALIVSSAAAQDVFNPPGAPFNVTSLTPNGVLLGNGTNPITATTAPAAGTVLCGSSGAPSFCAIPSVNQLNGVATQPSLILLSSNAIPISLQTGSAVSPQEQVRIAHTASTANIIQMTGAIATGAPQVLATGTDTDVALALSGKGAGAIDFWSNSFATKQVSVLNTVSANRQLTLTGSNSANPTISTTGGSVAFGTGIVVNAGFVQTTGPNTQTGATYSIVGTDNTVIANRAGTITMTLPAVGSSAGRRLRFVTITANTVVSAATNVVPLAGGAAGTAILAATAGKWADLECDGANWIITASN